MTVEFLRGAGLVWLLLACAIGRAETAEATAPTPVPEPDKTFVVPALEILAFDFLLNRYNARFSGSSDYDVTMASIRRNLRGPWVVDNDPFKVNQFAHPIQGSLYHGAGRATGLNYWEASALTFAGSVAWEIAGEKTTPARNDQIASGIAGSFLGEPLYRMAQMVLRQRSSIPAPWREWVAAAISPAVGFNRLAFGPRFGAAFDDHDPAYYGRMHIGPTHVTQRAFDPSPSFKRNMAQADFSLDYGLPGKPGYTYRRPFDYFNFQVLFSSANGIENMSTRGLLYGTDYAMGDNYRGIWGLYGNYDYLSPQIFHVSTTSLSLGTTAQWWATKDIAVQGTALAGLGYSAVSTTHRSVATDTEYHYGMAPGFLLALRAIDGSRASVDVGARMVSLGRITNRSAGRDEITRVDTALTWRITGPHAIGVNYLWSHRSASYLIAGARRQTLGTVGVYYTLLSGDGFGQVDWRTPANR
jgi:Domain of unknown function (DUF3943)